MRNCLSAAAVAALLFTAPAGAQDVTADTVLATVNGEEITVGHLIAARSRLPDEYRQLPPELLFDGLLEQLIQQAAVASETDDLSKRGRVLLENEERALKVNDVIAEASSAALTEEALQSAYDARYAGAEPEQEFNAAHILLETEERALEVLQEVRDGADFGDMAREHSTGPSGPNGGDLGWFGKGMMVPPFEEAVLSLEPGQVSEPVQTQFGWHIVRLNDVRQKDAPTLEEVRGELVDQVRQEAIEDLVKEATDSAEIDRVEAGSVDPSVMDDLSLLND